MPLDSAPQPPWTGGRYYVWASLDTPGWRRPGVRASPTRAGVGHQVLPRPGRAARRRTAFYRTSLVRVPDLGRSPLEHLFEGASLCGGLGRIRTPGNDAAGGAGGVRMSNVRMLWSPCSPDRVILSAAKGRPGRGVWGAQPHRAGGANEQRAAPYGGPGLSGRVALRLG